MQTSVLADQKGFPKRFLSIFDRKNDLGMEWSTELQYYYEISEKPKIWSTVSSSRKSIFPKKCMKTHPARFE